MYKQYDNQKALNVDLTTFRAFSDVTKLSFGNVIRFIYVYVINPCYTKAPIALTILSLHHKLINNRTASIHLQKTYQ